jgi:hypothetical protein
VASFDDWHKTHVFAANANHQLMPVTLHGGSYEKVSSDVSSRAKDLITQRLLKHWKASLFIKTENGGWRRLDHAGKSLELVSADVDPTDEWNDRRLGLKVQDAEDTKEAKAFKDSERRRMRRHDITAIQKSLAAHELTVSRLQVHVMHVAHEEKVHDAISQSLKISAYAPKKTGR